MSKSVLLAAGCLLAAVIGDRLLGSSSPEAAYQQGLAKGVDRGVSGARLAAVAHGQGEFVRDAAGQCDFRWREPSPSEPSSCEPAPFELAGSQ